MPDPDATAEPDREADHREPVVADAVQTTEAYETDEGVVFYDAENPLAWLQASRVVDLEDAA